MSDNKTSTRTLAQNRSLHLWMTMLGNQLSEAGLDQRKVLSESVDIPWTLEAVKNQLFRPIMKSMYGIESTTEMKADQLSKIADVLMRHLSEKFGMEFIAIPSIEYVLHEMQAKEKS